MPTLPRSEFQQYGPVLGPLLAEPRHLPLNIGRPNESVRRQLEAMSVETAFAHVRIADPAMAKLALAAVWLYHDYFEESHTIAQDVPSATGSYWHAIQHRREPDYANAKYWFRRVGRHAVYEPLRLDAAEAARESDDPAGRFLREQSQWDPDRFVDFVEQVVGTGGPSEMLGEQVQRIEWWLLFDHTYRRGAGL